ncbi:MULTISPECIES: class I SAM-dependent methyltransferase [Methylomonas]|uniref:class I SAM-dependent methyltransferase n=1 Tax=Methylomonas TaxID=416 RepID=UPI001231F42F|nr:methyltransferase domain-containing protein [Methylomonas rhizoryzae]
MIAECNRYLAERYAGNTAWEGFVLEAGGGSFSHFNLPGASQFLSIDIDYGQLARNRQIEARVQADLHRLPIRADCIRAVICFNVIEHLQQPDIALTQLIQSLVPGGIMILGFPNRGSLKGLITRLTPYGFHRWYYRWIVGKKDRGDGHYDVFPTPFHPLVDDKRISAWLDQHGMKVMFYRRYDGAKAYGITSGSLKRKLAALPYYFIAGIGEKLGLADWPGPDSDILLVAEKN